MKKQLFVYMQICFIASMMLLFSACGSQTQTPSVSVSPASRPTPSPTATPAVTPTPTVSTPVRLLIPNIHVDAPVENVGITQNGDLATPSKNPWDGVGWYSKGTRPGENGSAVINGHLDRPGGYPAVFWNLRQLHAGDIVTIQMADGQNLRFRVLRLASYPPQDAPLQSIFATTGGRYLNLITCAGTWIPAQHQTTLRLVVYTEQV